MILVFLARLIDESVLVLSEAFANRCQAVVRASPMLSSVKGAVEVCDRFARSRRRRTLSLYPYPSRVLALRQAACTAHAHVT